ncbi:MAG TPA: S8 family serine peptidase [Gryllotalpicola sp.]
MGTSRTLLSRTLAVVGAAAVMASALVSAVPADAAVPPAPSLHQGRHFSSGNYVVQLKLPAAATYTGGVSGYAATHPAQGGRLRARDAKVTKWSGYLAGRQKSAAQAVGAKIRYSYTLAFNGFSAHLTGAQASALARRSDVLAVSKDALLHPQAAARQPAEPDYRYLGLQNGPIGGPGASGLWAALGGPGNAGKGVVIGDLDTGISPANPSFAGAPLGTTPSSTEPYLDGDTITYTKSDGGTFTGICQTEAEDYDYPTPQDDSWTASDCSTKIVGARYFDLGFDPGQMGLQQGLEHLSPRDADGHGSHTASTAAGDYGVEATEVGRDFGAISGMAPAAKIADYKVCWDGPDPSSIVDDGCTASDMVAAINQAVADGVDVLNFSIGDSTGGASSVLSPTDYAFLGAAAAGIFVATSAGNAGPGTLDNASPWYATVAASTIPSYEGTATLGDGASYPGGTITIPDAGVNGSLVRADRVAAASYEADDPAQGYSVGDPVDPETQAALCYRGSLDAAAVAGKVVVCERGVNDRVDKSAEVKRAGGIGMILINSSADSLDLDAHAVPTLAVDASSYQAIWDYAATAGATVTLRDGNSTGVVTPVPQLAGFSSTGPVTVDGGDVLKPDISAPGVSILADGADASDGDGNWAPSYVFESGTSMAAPHIAGLAALYLGVHPTASVSEVKSAMMTTATDLVGGDGAPVDDPFAEGAGEVNPRKYLSPGLLYLNGLDDWLGYLEGEGYDAGADPIAPSDLNLASIAIGTLPGAQTVTRTVTSTQAGTYTPTASVPGYRAAVSPNRLHFTAAGQTARFTVTLTPTKVSAGGWVTGWLSWKGSGASAGITVRSPIGVHPVALVAPDTASGTGLDGSISVPLTVGVGGAPTVSAVGLGAEARLPDNGTAEDPDHTAGGSADDFDTSDQVFFVKVPDGTRLAKFREDPVSHDNDYDLYVYRVTLTDDSITDPTLADVDIANSEDVGSSATPSSEEEVQLTDPTAGWYMIEVNMWVGAGDYDVYSTLLGPATSVGGLTATVPHRPSTPGSTTAATVSWHGLTPNTSYVGLLSFDGGTAATVLDIESGDGRIASTAAPAITVRGRGIGARLTASPGSWMPGGTAFAYQWSVGGNAVRGATARTLTLTKAQLGKPVTVTVTASKAGWTSASASSAAVTVAVPIPPGHPGRPGKPGKPGHGSPGHPAPVGGPVCPGDPHVPRLS